MAKTVFSNGMRVSPQHFNALNNPRFVVDEDGEEFDGQHFRIRDDSLSNDPTQIKGRFMAFEGELAVRAGTGLAVAYNGGRVSLPSGLITTIAPGVITGLPDNSTTFVYVNKNGVVTHSENPDVVRFLMAQVTTSGGAVSQITDLRQRFQISARAEVTKIFGGSGSQGDLIVTTSATLSDGIYYFNNLIVASGAVLTINRFAKIFCAGNVQIDGSVNVTTATRGGVGFRRGPHEEYIYPSDGEGFGAGSTLVGGTPYNPLLSPVGSGGASSFIHQISGPLIEQGIGGRGGGGLWIECGSRLTIGSTGAISANGEPGIAPRHHSGSGSFYVGGSGGGSGGTVVLTAADALLVSAGASISCNGGRGSDAIRSGTDIISAGGGGGGGGIIWVMCPNAPVVLGTLSVNGGAGGASAGTGASTHGSAGGGANGGHGGHSPGSITMFLPASPGGIGKILISNFLPAG